MAHLLVLNGPNLNMLGVREPTVYGRLGLADIENNLRQFAHPKHELAFMQSNAEHQLIDRIHQAFTDGTDFVLINPGAFTHTSIALRDAFLSTNIPFIEIHISNVFAREKFRHLSYLSDIAKGVVCGLGVFGYEVALRAAIHHLEGSGISNGH